MNIQRNKNRKLVMNLEQALLQYGNDINYIILRDGTNIEIIDEFIEEKFEDNYGYDNYMYKEIDQNGTLRGKGLKKSLRKTVLKSINNQGKLRSTNSNNIDNNKVIIKQTEDNEYLQCANCYKFFNSKESDEETENTSNNNDNNNNNINANNNKNQYNEKIRPQMPAQIPPKQNQQYPPYQPNIPPKQAMPPQPKYNQNNFNNPPPPYYNPQYPQRGPQQRMNVPPTPHPPQNFYNNQIPKGNMRIPPVNSNQNNQVFRSRKRNSGKYQQNEIRQNNYVINKYPGSGKKQLNTEYDVNYYQNEIKYYEYPSINYAHSSNKQQQQNNYYQNEVNEFQENDYYGY